MNQFIETEVKGANLAEQHDLDLGELGGHSSGFLRQVRQVQKQLRHIDIIFHRRKRESSHSPVDTLLEGSTGVNSSLPSSDGEVVVRFKRRLHRTLSLRAESGGPFGH